MSGINQIEILRIFKDLLVKFLDALIEQLPQESDLIVLRIMLGEQIPIEEVISIFCNRILPYTDYIFKHDERFFIDCTDIFEGIKSDKVSYFKRLYQSPTFNEHDKQQIWKWFETFAKLAIKYKPFLSPDVIANIEQKTIKL